MHVNFPTRNEIPSRPTEIRDSDSYRKFFENLGPKPHILVLRAVKHPPKSLETKKKKKNLRKISSFSTCPPPPFKCPYEGGTGGTRLEISTTRCRGAEEIKRLQFQPFFSPALFLVSQIPFLAFRLPSFYVFFFVFLMKVILFF